MRHQAILFDLDGTLVDSAPDLAGAANELRALHGREPVPYEQLRPMAGAGARGMLGTSFGIAPGDEGYADLREAFLRHYEARLLRESRPFPAIESMLAAVEASARPWGVVTNKALHLAVPLLTGLGLHRRAAVLVGGDSTPHTKPHPGPLLHAAATLGVAPDTCVYIGDDHRDIRAGRAAGMATVAVRWGYLGLGEPIEAWGADAVVGSPSALLDWLRA